MNQQYRHPFQTPPGPLAKILGALGAVVLLVASFFLGIVFLGAALLFVLVVAVLARFGKPADRPTTVNKKDGSVLEGEYVVIEQRRNEKRDL